MSLYRTPDLDREDEGVLGEIHHMRDGAADVLRAPRRWSGGLRRTTQARAIQGSNTIEGYTVSDDDALAAVDDQEPLTADQRTWAEIIGYRRVLTYVVYMAVTPGFRLDDQLLRSIHFTLLDHDLTKSPGQFRAGPVYVSRESDGETVYEGPAAEQVPALVAELMAELATPGGDAMVRAAMAHLNLVMIHPFRDGNGRMARILQTLVLAQDLVLEPTFSSVEEWLGRNTDDYFRVLAVTGQGSWRPDLDAHLWVKFSLRAHHMQAQTLTRRMAESARVGSELLGLLADAGLPERTFDPVFDAAMGLLVRRPTYVKRSGVEERTATRDLKALADAGFLTARGNTRARYYLAAGPVAELRADSRRRRQALRDPYPWLRADLAGRAQRLGE
ncbi:MAG: Fic family protein [Austwickia sp.]|nr:Fic family protein [Austwickia sp.]